MNEEMECKAEVYRCLIYAYISRLLTLEIVRQHALVSFFVVAPLEAIIGSNFLVFL